MVKVCLELSDRAWEVFVAEAGELGTTPTNLVQEAVEREGRRMFYVRQARPKAKADVERGPGRPPLTAVQRRVRELAKSLRGVYARRLEQLGTEAFQELGLREQLAEVEAVVREGDLERLEQIEREQPWRQSWGRKRGRDDR